MVLFGSKKPTIKTQMEAFNSMKESLSNAVYEEVGKRLVEESKAQMERIEKGLNERLEGWESELKKFIVAKIEEEIHKKTVDLNDEI